MRLSLPCRLARRLVRIVQPKNHYSFPDDSKNDLKPHLPASMAGCEESCGFYFVFAFFTFFVWMDMSFYDELQEYGSFYNDTVADTLMFPAKTVKVRLQDHTSHYINLPFMQLLEDKLGISEIPGVTPNLITGIHLAFAILAAKCFISGSLCIRRLGCVLYEVRYQLDLLDGVVYRAQQKMKHQYTSGWGTVGYLVDAFADFIGGILVAVSCTIFLNRYLPLKRVKGRPLYDEEVARKPAFDGGSELAKLIHVSRRSVNIKMVLVTVQIMARSALWDYYCHAYHDLLEAPRPDIPRSLQNDVLSYRSTWAVFWLWKVSTADAFLQFTLLAVLFDKLWMWIQFLSFFGPLELASLVVLSQLHLMEVKAYLMGS